MCATLHEARCIRDKLPPSHAGFFIVDAGAEDATTQAQEGLREAKASKVLAQKLKEEKACATGACPAVDDTAVSGPLRPGIPAAQPFAAVFARDRSGGGRKLHPGHGS